MINKQTRFENSKANVATLFLTALIKLYHIYLTNRVTDKPP